MLVLDVTDEREGMKALCIFLLIGQSNMAGRGNLAERGVAAVIRFYSYLDGQVGMISLAVNTLPANVPSIITSLPSWKESGT